MENKPLNYCFSTTGQLATQAAQYLWNASVLADSVRYEPGRAPAVEAELGAIREDFGQYFPVGVEAGTIQAALSLAFGSLSKITGAAMDAAGELTPPPFTCYAFPPQHRLNEPQTMVLNAGVEFVRLSIAAARWLLRLTDRAIYEREARAVLQQWAGVLDVYPLSSDDEQAAARAMVPIRENIEVIRAALNIYDFPELDGKQANAKLQKIGGKILYLTGAKTGQIDALNSWGVEGLDLDNIVL